MEKLLEQLNPQQLSAVTITNQPLRIIAGAGSGKTKVITTKIAYLIKHENIKPNRILAMTFTNKAAREMKERVLDILGNDLLVKPYISTFHSWCSRVLREDFEHANLNKNFLIIDKDEQKQVIKEAIKELAINTSVLQNGFERTLLYNIGEWKNELNTPEDILENEYDEATILSGRVYKKYEEILKQNNAIDFNDLQLLVYKMFNSNSEILLKWQNRYDYVLVDEFQDTNDLQFRLVKQINANRNGLTVVGDPDQTIYSWRGAELSIIVDFTKIFANAVSITLEQNYRSTKQILDLANDFIDNNKNRVKKNIFTTKEHGPQVEVKEASTRNVEARYVANKIKELIDEGYQYKDIFILYRINAWSQEFEKEFFNSKIPFQLIGGIKFRERKVIKDAIAYLKMIVTKEEFFSKRILNTIPKIGRITIEKLVSAAEKENVSIFDLIVAEDKTVLHSVTKYLDYLAPIFLTARSMFEDNANVEDIMKYIFVATGYEQKLKDLKDDDNLQNIYALYDQMKNFDEDYENTDLKESGINKLVYFLQEESISDTEEEYSEANRVTLLTIHSAKGLENKIVFVSGLNRDVFPSYRSMGSLGELEEERRALYVALTRAEEKLFITYVSGEFSHFSRNPLAPSKFISELNKELYKFDGGIFANKNDKLIEVDHTQNNAGTVSAQLLNTKGYQKGDLVGHRVFGEGVIINNNNGQLQIAFNNSSYGVMFIAANNSMLFKK